jgi:hypothetical protein
VVVSPVFLQQRFSPPLQDEAYGQVLFAVQEYHSLQLSTFSTKFDQFLVDTKQINLEGLSMTSTFADVVTCLLRLGKYIAIYMSDLIANL